MRVTVLAFHPESIAVVRQRLMLLFAGRDLEVDVVFPSLPLGEAAEVWEDVEAGLAERLAAIGEPVRVLHLEPGRFVEALLQPTPPALVVLAYTQFGERVAAAANMLALRNFPILMLGYES